MLKGVLTDIDGTLTDERRRLNLHAILTIRRLQDAGVSVVLSSGNTSCLLKGLSKLIGTSGTFIGENGGVYRIGFEGSLKIMADRTLALSALNRLISYYAGKGIPLDLYSQGERYADVAFARTVPVDEVRTLLADMEVSVLDTGFAIHIQQTGISKGKTFLTVSQNIGISTDEFLAIGDSENDIEMIQAAGTGCCVANAGPVTRAAARFVANQSYGEGFVEVMEMFFPWLRE